ncbi:hypothetical protein [Synechococcus phage S-MS29]|nr:hypothetical protein [Synechococcus phage S-MS29]
MDEDMIQLQDDSDQIEEDYEDIEFDDESAVDYDLDYTVQY